MTGLGQRVIHQRPRSRAWPMETEADLQRGRDYICAIAQRPEPAPVPWPARWIPRLMMLGMVAVLLWGIFA